MKKIYANAEIEVIALKEEDVIRTSELGGVDENDNMPL